MRGILRPLLLKESRRETTEKIQRTSRARTYGNGRLRELVKRMFEHVIDNCSQLVGGGCRGFGRPEFTPHPAKKGSEIAGAGTETLGRHAQGATGAILHPSTARGEHFATADLIVRTEP